MSLATLKVQDWFKRFFTVKAMLSFICVVFLGAVLIVVLSIWNKSRAQTAEVMDKIISFNGHMIVRPANSSFENYLDVSKRLEAIPEILHAMPVVEGQGMVSSPTYSSGVIARGLREQDLQSFKAISGNIRFGTIDNFDTSNGIIISMKLANSLNVSVGGEIRLLTTGASRPFGMLPRIKRYRVVAIFEMDMPQFNNAIVFMPLSEAKSFFNMGSSVHVLQLIVKNPYDLDALKPAIKNVVGSEMMLTDWRERLHVPQ